MKIFYTLLLTIFSFILLNAQELFPFEFTYEQGEYTDLENPISLTNGEVWDDPNFTVPLGFNFEYLGQSVTTLNANDNLSGAMLLAGIGSSDGINMIIPYFSDLQDRGALTNESLSEINYEIVGESPNKIAKIEWKNAGFYDEINENFESTSFVNLQIWVYEGSNEIAIIFGENDINTKIAHEYGGASLGFVQNLNFSAYSAELVWNLFGNPYDPEISELKDADLQYTDPPIFIADPIAGTTYRFVPNDFTSSTNQSVELKSVAVYPTIVSDQLFIENNSQEQVDVHIFDGIGSQIAAYNYNPGVEQIDLSGYSSGMYFVNIQQGNAVTNQKVVKQ